MKKDIFQQAQWIWVNTTSGKDEYGEFYKLMKEI